MTNTIKTNSIVKSTKKAESVRIILVDCINQLTETTSERKFLELVAKTNKSGFLNGKSIDYRNEVSKACEIVAQTRYTENAESLPVMVLKQNYFVVEFQNTETLLKGIYASFTKEEKQPKPKTEKTENQKVIDYLKKSKLSKAELLEIVNSL